MLRDNYDQTLALSVAQRRGVADLDAQARFMRELEAAAGSTARSSSCPTTRPSPSARKAGRGLTRPELAVLLAYGKLDLFDEMLASTVPDDPLSRRRRWSAISPRRCARFGDEMRRHRLRREIIATQLTNR